ncbi:MAG: hypothetical protein WKF60_13250 [Ilumatobacter sp.]
MDKWCDSARLAAVRSQAVEIPIYGPPIVRVALIPDRFATSAAARPDLGTYEANILTVRDDAPAGRHDLSDDVGGTLQLVVPTK